MSEQKTIRVFSGAPWESKVGYCRAIHMGSIVAVTGTTSIDEYGNVFGEGDAYLQTKRCFEIIMKALSQLDVRPDQIIRTRMFVTDMRNWEAHGRAHREVFRNHPPATSMIEVKGLMDPKMLIEIEADAVTE